jgi:hypothetical protein
MYTLEKGKKRSTLTLFSNFLNPLWYHISALVPQLRSGTTTPSFHAIRQQTITHHCLLSLLSHGTAVLPTEGNPTPPPSPKRYTHATVCPFHWPFILLRYSPTPPTPLSALFTGPLYCFGTPLHPPRRSTQKSNAAGGWVPQSKRSPCS